MGNVDSRSGRRAASVLRLAAVPELALMALTWKLWSGASRFPRVALLEHFAGWPVSTVVAVSALFAMLTLCCTIRPPETTHRAACALGIGTIVAGMLAVACNQHVLQPWHWMFLLIVLFQVVVPRARVERLASTRSHNLSLRRPFPRWPGN